MSSEASQVQDAVSLPTPPTWSDKLRVPFEPHQIHYKPRLTCQDCRKAPGRVCNKASHVLIQCPRCHQWISSAHVDLDYVGHADVTDRLLNVDPRWYWQPAYTAVNQEVLLAAIATGDAEIVRSVIENAPPLIDDQGGMWMVLTIHDDDGTAVNRMCYGDSSGKTGTDAMKELIGDGIRNGAQRFGVALELWSKSDRTRDEADASLGDGKLRRSPRKPAEAATGALGVAPATPVQADVQALAALAAALLDKRVDPGELYQQVYVPASRKRGWLRAPCADPWTGELSTLSDVISTAKQQLLADERRAGEPDAQ